MVFGLLKKEDLNAIRTCLKNTQNISNEIADIYNKMSKLDISDMIGALSEIGDLILELPSDMDGCVAMQGDIDRIQNWATPIFTDPWHIMPIIATNTAKNLSPLVNNANEMIQIMLKNPQDYHRFGELMASQIVMIVGPINSLGQTAPEQQPENLSITQW